VLPEMAALIPRGCVSRIPPPVKGIRKRLS
jgi:hypothetical protein